MVKQSKAWAHYLEWRREMESKYGRMLYVASPRRVVKLAYVGPLVQGQKDSPKAWTILTHFIGADGADYFRSTRTLEGLRELGIIKTSTLGGN